MSVASQPTTAMLPPRSWFRRNLKWFVPGMLAVAVAMAGIAVFSYVQIRSYKYRQNPSYQAALAAVQDSQRVRQRIGEPIVDSDWNPQGAIEVRDDASIGEARFNFDIAGPEGNAVVSTTARMVEGEWALNTLEVRFSDDEVVRLTEEVLAKQKVDTPKFDAATEKQPKASADKPPKDVIELNVDVPEAPPSVK
jgi:hypothetical protein